VATGVWRILHDEEEHNMYFSPNTVTVIESKWIRWTGDIARMGTIITASENLKGRNLL
jgi:hypothetical protein